MAENPENDNKENNVLIEFLTEDLKETGEYLRETDRKLSFLIQIYTGAFVVISTLSANKIIDPKALLGSSGLALIFIFIIFTLWLYVYALKSKETKAVYIHRMNFVRREVHYYLQTKYYDLTGYWTSPELSNSQRKTIAVTPSQSEKTKPKRVGLDDLYPIALRWILILLGVILVIIFSYIIHATFTLGFLKSTRFPPLIVISILVPVIIWLISGILKKNSEKNINDQIKAYQNSSLKRDQENQAGEVNQKNTNLNTQFKRSNRIKKQTPAHD